MDGDRITCPTCKGLKRMGPYVTDDICSQCRGVGHVKRCQDFCHDGKVYYQSEEPGTREVGKCFRCKGTGAEP